MNSLKKPGQSWHIGIRTKAALGYAVTILKVRFLLRYIYSRLVEHAYRLRALGILTVTNVIAFASYQAFGLESLQSTELATIYAGAATMVGGVLAIVFTLSVFALQRAGDIYSARYYTVFTHDWKEKFIYSNPN